MSKKKYHFKRKKTAGEEVRESVKRFNWKLALMVLAVFAAVFVIYEVGIYFEFKPIVHIYAWAILCMIVAYVILNKGLGKPKKPEAIEAEAAKLEENEREDFIRRENGKSRASVILLIFIFAFIVTYLIDLIYLYFEFNIKPLWK